MKNIKAKVINFDLIVHLLFLILSVFAVIFFKERLFTDAGYYIFRTINNESFWIEHNRFVLIFPQVLPLIAVKLKLNLQFILVLYSLSHVLLPYLIFLLTRYGFKNKETGILLLLLQTIGLLSAYFTPVFELYYGVSLLVLFAVVLDNKIKKVKYLCLLVALELLILTSHPYSNILFAFVIILHINENNWKYYKQYLLFGSVLIGVFIFKIYTASEYEQGKTKAFINTLNRANYDLIYLKSLAGFLITYYKELLILLLTTFGYYFMTKKYIKSIIVVSFFLINLVIINISYYGFEHSRYQEQVYFSLIFIGLFPFTIDMLKNIGTKYRTVFYLLTFALIVNRLFLIYEESDGFNNRTNTMEHLINQAQMIDGSKYEINQDYITNDSCVGPNWSYPIETMLISGLNADHKTITICTEEDMSYNDNRSKLRPNAYLFRRWEIYDINTLNQYYFHLENSDYYMLDGNKLLQ